MHAIAGCATRRQLLRRDDFPRNSLGALDDRNLGQNTLHARDAFATTMTRMVFLIHAHACVRIEFLHASVHCADRPKCMENRLFLKHVEHVALLQSV